MGDHFSSRPLNSYKADGSEAIFWFRRSILLQPWQTAIQAKLLHVSLGCENWSTKQGATWLQGCSFDFKQGATWVVVMSNDRLTRPFWTVQVMKALTQRFSTSELNSLVSQIAITKSPETKGLEECADQIEESDGGSDWMGVLLKKWFDEVRVGFARRLNQFQTTAQHVTSTPFLKCGCSWQEPNPFWESAHCVFVEESDGGSDWMGVLLKKLCDEVHVSFARRMDQFLSTACHINTIPEVWMFMARAQPILRVHTVFLWTLGGLPKSTGEKPCDSSEEKNEREKTCCLEQFFLYFWRMGKRLQTFSICKVQGSTPLKLFLRDIAM